MECYEYLPSDTNTLLAVSNKAFQDRECINVLVTSKQPRDTHVKWSGNITIFFVAMNMNIVTMSCKPNSIEEAEKLVDQGLSYVDWASTDKGANLVGKQLKSLQS